MHTWASPRLPANLVERLTVPVIAAPMFRVSGPDLVIAACAAGAMAAFPTGNIRTTAELDEWLTRVARAAKGAAVAPAPHCANLTMNHLALSEHLDCLLDHRVEVVITSLGSPAPAVEALHRVGSLIFSDVATLGHARKAVDAGADGLVLLTTGSGGQTGWLNPFAFVRAVRDFFDGPVILAGGLSDGVALRAALELGADLGYVGTRFIAAKESMASEAYRTELVSASIDDIVLTSAFTGLPASFVRSTIVAAGLDPDALDEQVTPEIAEAVYGGGRNNTATGPKRWTDIVSAGHSVSGVRAVEPARMIVERLAAEFTGAA